MDTVGGLGKCALRIMALPSILLYFPCKTLGIWKRCIFFVLSDILGSQVFISTCISCGEGVRLFA